LDLMVLRPSSSPNGELQETLLTDDPAALHSYQADPGLPPPKMVGSGANAYDGSSDPEDDDDGDGDSFYRVHGSLASSMNLWARSLTPHQRLQLRVWRCINGPLDKGDAAGQAVYAFFQAVVVAFIVLVVLETDSKWYDPHALAMDALGTCLAVVITLEYLLSLWSVAVHPDFAQKLPLGGMPSGGKGRLKWALGFMPLVDLVVLLSFWTTALIKRLGHGHSAMKTKKIVGAFQVLRMLRLMRVVDLFESNARVKRAFRLLTKVCLDKGDDILAALIVMFVSLIFIAT